MSEGVKPTGISTIKQGTPEQNQARMKRGGRARMRAIKAQRAQERMAERREKA